MRCAVLGSPIGHSLSPVLHRAAYAELGLDWEYDAREVRSGELPEFLAQKPSRGGNLLKRDGDEVEVTLAATRKRNCVTERLQGLAGLIGGESRCLQPHRTLNRLLKPEAG